jgi:hypothetical protein
MTSRMRQEPSVTPLLLQSVSRVCGLSEIVTQNTLQYTIKQIHNFTKENIDPTRCSVRQSRCKKNVYMFHVNVISLKRRVLKACTGATIDLTWLPPRNASIEDEIWVGKRISSASYWLNMTVAMLGRLKYNWATST